MNEPSCGVQINHLEATCLFSGRNLDRLRKQNEGKFDDICKLTDRSKTFTPEPGQIVGVFYKPSFIWRRGKVVGRDELGYKVFLIDYGEYIHAQSKYLQHVSQLTFPPQFIRLCLRGAIPCVPLTKDIQLDLMDLFRNATLYLTNIVESDNQVIIADATVKKRDEQSKDLMTILLQKGYVKESDTYLREMQTLINGLDNFDDLFTQFETCPMELSKNPMLSEARSGSRRTTTRKSELSDENDLAMCMPAGFHYENKSKNNKHRDSRSKSVGRTSKPQRYSYRSTSCRRIVDPESSDSPNESTSRPRVSAKKVTWVDEESESDKESQDSAPKKRFGFNLNYKAGVPNEKNSSPHDNVNHTSPGVECSSFSSVKSSVETNKPSCVGTITKVKSDIQEENAQNSVESINFAKLDSGNAKETKIHSFAANSTLNTAKVLKLRQKCKEKEENRRKSSDNLEIGVTEKSVVTKQKLDCETKESKPRSNKNNSDSEVSQTSCSSDSLRNHSELFRQKLNEAKIKLQNENGKKAEVPNQSEVSRDNLGFGNSTRQKFKEEEEKRRTLSDNLEIGVTEKSVVTKQKLDCETKESKPRANKSNSDSDASQTSCSSDSLANRSELFRQKLNEAKIKLQNENGKKAEVPNQSEVSRDNLGFGNSSGLRQMQFNSDTSSVISNDPDSSQNASSLFDSTEDMMRKHEKMNEFEQLMKADPTPMKAGNLKKSLSHRTDSYIPNAAAGVLLHTRDKKVIPPIKNLGDCQLDNSVIQKMELFYLRELNRVQMHSYPTICAKRNMMIVAGPRDGKTSGYVIPLVSNMLNPEDYRELKDTVGGPRCVVISPYAEKASQVSLMFQQIGPSLDVIHTHGGAADQEKKVALKGCDVLVSTPRCLVRMLENRSTNFKRLCHMVFDDCEILFEKFKPEVEELLVLADKVMRDRKTNIQVVATSKLWTPQVERFCHLMVDPTICIVNTQEACMYTGLRPTAILVPRDKKIDKLFALLKEVEGKKRGLVACKSEEEVNYISRVLVDMGMNKILVAHKNMTSVDITDVNTLWKSQSFAPILVRSDEVLEEVPVIDAQVLIHYDMPVTLKTFGRRFFSLLENYQNILVEDSQPKTCQAHIFMDEEDDLPAPSVMKFMTRLGTVLPDKVQNMLEDLEHKREAEKTNKALCENLKLFGRCWDQKQCLDRHIVNKELDDLDNIPSVGKVKILVHHIHNACHYSARLVEHKTKGVWESIPSKMVELSLKLKNYFRKESNRRMIATASIGDIVAYEFEEEFHRVMILEVSKFNRKNEPVNAHVRLIDVGSFCYHVPLVHLYSLPQEMTEVPPSVVDVYLCNLQPKDLDIQWSSALVPWVYQQLAEVRHKDSNGYLIGKIVLRLGGSLWLNPLEYWSSLDHGASVFLLSLRTELLCCGNAIDNPDHLPVLKQLCAKAGIEIPEEVKASQVKRECRWAWLPTDKVEVVHVVVIEAPDIVFLQLTSFSDNLMDLTKDIQSYMKDESNGTNPVTLLEVGDICLAKSQDGWNRAMVHNIISEAQVEVFFVDYGDLAALPWSDVANIPDKFISILPFQTIECYFDGVSFKESEDSTWEDEVVDTICDLTRNENCEAIDLQVMVCDVELEGKISKGRRYKVILSDTNNEEIVVINKKLACLSNLAFFEENNNLVEKYTKPKTFEDEIVGSDEGEDFDINQEVSMYGGEEFDINEEVNMDEKERLMVQFLRSIGDSKKFDEDDVKNFVFEAMGLGRVPRRAIEESRVSDLSSESTSSEQKVIIREIKGNEEHLASNASSTSEKSSTQNPQSSLVDDHGFNTNLSSIAKPSQKMEDNCEVLNQDFLHLRANNFTQSTPIADSSLSETFHTVRTSLSPAPVSPLNVEISKDSFAKSASPSPNSSIFSKLKGGIYNFKDMISPTFYESPSTSFNSPEKLNLMDKVKPFVRNLLESAMEEDILEGLDVNCAEESQNETFQSCARTDNEIEITPSKPTTEPLTTSKNEEKKESPRKKWVEATSLIDSSTSDDTVSITSNNINECDYVNPTYDQCSNELSPITRCPSVEWYQDDELIYIYIKLPEVQKYELTYGTNWIDFRANYQGLNYHVNLKLFGGHCKEAIKYASKAFNFEIKLQKFLRGKKFIWPRLIESTEKCFWLRFNQEKGLAVLTDSEDEEVTVDPDSALCALTWKDGHLNLDVESLASDAPDTYVEESEEDEH